MEKKLFKTKVGKKNLEVSFRQLNNTHTLADKINKLGGNIGSGHDGITISPLNKKGTSYTVIFISFYGGPVWHFKFNLVRNKK